MYLNSIYGFDYEEFKNNHPPIYIYKILDSGEIQKETIFDYDVSFVQHNTRFKNSESLSTYVSFCSKLMYGDVQRIRIDRFLHWSGGQSYFITIYPEEVALKYLYEKTKRLLKKAKTDAKNINAKVDRYSNIVAFLEMTEEYK